MGTILREGLLAGRTLLAASPAPSEALARAAQLCGELGATVHPAKVDPLGEELDATTLGGPLAAGGELTLVWDGIGAFSAAGGIDGARAALDGAWLATRPVAAAYMIPEAHGGKIIFLAPSPGGPHAEAARAGLENLARVTSVEWARFEIRIVAIHPGPATTPGEIADLVAYLASPAGDYATGCVFALR